MKNQLIAGERLIAADLKGGQNVDVENTGVTACGEMIFGRSYFPWCRCRLNTNEDRHPFGGNQNILCHEKAPVETNLLSPTAPRSAAQGTLTIWKPVAAKC